MHSTGIRKATHAGSWYSKDGNKLANELKGWLNSATLAIPGVNLVKAIIGP
jgi:predicted class III extradiol MEMO1 family dioxygenase